ncbi:PIR Superfamily Protein [Plasmodium ovale wallikeri]|uniref:PIR protein n=2 Tax=Plasmodium ovale TaxID=36330 RepID=A0A1C3KJ45_PLAOA|nr:PIR Superfamily Protein [Plasmodium ovale wallikeri]SBT73878.1 PIR protein [Plasmodium ovale]
MTHTDIDDPDVTSINHYRKLDSFYSKYGNEEECKLLAKTFGTYPRIYDFCMSLTGNLLMINTLKRLSTYEMDPCLYLNCWIYDKVINIDEKLTSEHLASIFSSILPYWKSYGAEGKCNTDFITYVNKDNFTKIKNLYDYALNYRMIVYELSRSNYECSEKYAEYINNSRNMFESVKAECTNYYVKPYCIALKYIDQVFKENELLNLRCNSIKKKIPQVAEERNSRQTSSALAHQDGPYIQTGDHPGQPYGGPVQSLVSEVGNEHTSSTNGITIAVPILGSLLFSFILYKFTPFGTWLHKSFLKKKLIGTNIDEEASHELLEIPYDNMEENIHVSKHHIGYHA